MRSGAPIGRWLAGRQWFFCFFSWKPRWCWKRERGRWVWCVAVGGISSAVACPARCSRALSSATPARRIRSPCRAPRARAGGKRHPTALADPHATARTKAGAPNALGAWLLRRPCVACTGCPADPARTCGSQPRSFPPILGRCRVHACLVGARSPR